MTMPLPGIAWHAHEMIFGFALAVIAGFLLTAVRTWTGRATPSGPALAALFALWAAGRVAMVTGPAPLALTIDVAFPVALAVVLAMPLWRSGNRRNAFVVPWLGAMAVLAALHHGAWSGWAGAEWAPRATAVALGLIALLLAVIGGRVIPTFSGNAVPGLAIRRNPVLEWAAIGSLGVVAALDLAAPVVPRWLWSGLLSVAALVHLLRLGSWRPWATRGNPLLLALPLGYLWLPAHLILRAALDGGPGAMASPALHAVAVGAMTTTMLAMMTRSALGHTGRVLAAGPAEMLVFAAIHGAALLRVFGPLAWPAAHAAWVGAATLLWVVGLATFVARYGPIALRPRLPDS